MTPIEISKKTKKRFLLALWNIYVKKNYYLPITIKSNFKSALKKGLLEKTKRNLVWKNNKRNFIFRKHVQIKLKAEKVAKLKLKRTLCKILKKTRSHFYFAEKKKTLIKKEKKLLKILNKIQGKNEKHTQILKERERKKIEKLNFLNKLKIKKKIKIYKKQYRIFLRKFKKIKSNKKFFQNSSNLSLITDKKIFSYKINIIVKSNNVFCNLAQIDGNKTKHTCTAGKYNTKISKKTIRFSYNNIITTFFKKIKKTFYKKKKKPLDIFKAERKRNKKAWRFYLIPRYKSGVIFNIIASTRKRRKILKNIKYNFKDLNLLIKVLEKKIFNGCRAPKKVRKKRRRMRILK